MRVYTGTFYNINMNKEADEKSFITEADKCM
jgi:hypothetical protein